MFSDLFETVRSLVIRLADRKVPCRGSVAGVRGFFPESSRRITRRKKRKDSHAVAVWNDIALCALHKLMV